MPSPRFDGAAVDTPFPIRLVDEATEHYVAWREECAAVRAGYLDREECAAEPYALTVDVSASRRPSFDGS
jgi:hypothetical protein